MANYDIVVAITSVLRAATNIRTPVGGRFFGVRVPPDAPFPRCYIQRQTPPRRDRRSTTGVEQDITGIINVLFACTSVETTDPENFIESLDTLAEAALDNVHLPNVSGLVYFRRDRDIPVYPQEDDRLSFYVGGGGYEFYRQVN